MSMTPPSIAARRTRRGSRRGRASMGRASGRDGRVFVARRHGVSLGAWGHHSRQQVVMATAEWHRDFVPSLRVATVVANPAMVSVSLPATTAGAFAQAANIYARATGYIGKKENVDIGDSHVKQGDLLVELAVPGAGRPDFSGERIDAQTAQIGAGPGAGRLEARPGDLGPATGRWSIEGWVTQAQQGTIDVQTLKAQAAEVALAQNNVTAQEKNC